MAMQSQSAAFGRVRVIFLVFSSTKVIYSFSSHADLTFPYQKLKKASSKLLKNIEHGDLNEDFKA